MNIAFLWRSAKVFSAKFYFQAIRYRASGRGALGYHKFVMFSPRKSIFKQLDTALVGVVHWVTTNL